MSSDSLAGAGEVALADFRQRTRSRRLLAVFVVVAYVGYQINVGTFDLLYQDTVGGELINYRGERTAAYVGLTSGVTGATVLLFFGYYLLSGSIARDRTTGVDELLASTPISDAAYLFGKWLSHVGMVVVLLSTLGGAALVNHAVHGTGVTDPVWILGPIFLVGLPLGCAVAGVTVLFRSTRRLDGTLGNVVYLFGGMTLLTTVLAAGVESAPRWIRLLDVIGLYAAGEMTFDALLAVAPEYGGPPVANYGTGTIGGEVAKFHWDGGSWPAWFYANRLGLVVLGGLSVLAAVVPYERYSPSEGANRRTLIDRFERIVPSSLAGGSTAETGSRPPEEISLTPVEDRSNGGGGRLLLQELRLLLRGHPWWWYLGSIAVVGVGVTGDATGGAAVSIAAIWPLFVWSGMGYRPVHHRITPFIVSSRRPFGQLLAEWAAGALVTAGVFGAALWPTIADTGVDGVAVLVGAVLFVPSLAQALGLWSGTRRLFEVTYLVLWYVGPLNGVPPLDFAGATGATTGTAIPLLFAGAGVIALAAAIAHRQLQVRDTL